MKPGVTELLIVLAVVILIFGPTQIPKLAKLIGKSVKNLRKGMADAEEDSDSDDDEVKETKPEKKEKSGKKSSKEADKKETSDDGEE